MLMPSTPAEERLEQLLQAPDFPPPAGFAAQAEVADAAVYERAAADPQAWWAGQARQRLDWDTPFAEVLDDSPRSRMRCVSTWPSASANLPGRSGSSGAEDVPKTRSGKIMRRLLRDIAEGRNPGDATTLRDASVLAKLQQATAQDDKEFTGTPKIGSTR